MVARRKESEKTLDPLLLGLRLGPFFASCALYFLLWLPSEEPSWTSALVKCLPVLCLAAFARTSACPGPGRRFTPRGLLCSALGDALLIWPSGFLFGMAAFAGAHLCYLGALGWWPLRPLLLGPVAAAFGAYVGLLHPQLPPGLGLPVLLYAAVLGLVLWRGLARGGPAALGGLLFSVSDAVLAWDTFVRPLPLGRLVIMVTYYSAQALLALAAVQPRALKAD